MDDPTSPPAPDTPAWTADADAEERIPLSGLWSPPEPNGPAADTEGGADAAHDGGDDWEADVAPDADDMAALLAEDAGLPVPQSGEAVVPSDEEAAAPPPVAGVPGDGEPDTRDIPLEDIAEVANIRPDYDETALEELAASLRAQGQLEPVWVRPAADDAEHGRPWELIFGYRRKRAAERVPWTHIRAEVHPVSDTQLLDAMISENLQREDLSPIAEARAMQAMIQVAGISQAEVARRLGVHASHVSHRLQLLGLAEPVRELIDRGEISASHGEALAVLPDEQQERFAERAARDGVPVRKLEGWVRQVKEEETYVPPEPPAPLEMVRPDDVTTLPALRLRPDLDAAMQTRLVAYILLRNAHDQEMLEYLEAEMATPYERLWPWVATLSDDEVAQLVERLTRRYLEAAHRYPSLEAELVSDIGDPSAPPTPRPALGAPLEDEVDEDPEWDAPSSLPPAPPELRPTFDADSDLVEDVLAGADEDDGGDEGPTEGPDPAWD